MNELDWKDRKRSGGQVLDNGEGIVYLSYQPNEWHEPCPMIDSSNPETAIVLENDKGEGMNRYLIYRGDWRKQLEEIYPDVEKLKQHWREHGGHFRSDSLDEEGPMTDQTLEERLDDMLLRHGAEQGELHYSLRSEIIALIRDEKLALINYVLSRPTGELTMKTEQMKGTPDEKWRDEVIQYFFNTESLMMNLDRMRTALAAIKDEIGESDE